MYKSFRVIMAISGAVITTQIGAYTYRFENTTNKEMEVSFKLAGINEPTETVRVPAMNNDGKPGTASRSIGGWRVGLCLKGRDDLSMRMLPDGRPFLPLLIGKDSSYYKEFLETNTVPSGIFDPRKKYQDKERENMPFVFYRTNPLLLCFDRTFRIVETSEHQFILIYE